MPVNTAKKLLPQLRQGRDIERAYLGVRTATVTAEAADELDLARDSGALLDEVTEDGPADDAGLRDGDLVVQIEGKTIADSQDLVDAVAAEKPGDRIEIVFYRGDDRRTERVELGERPDEITSGDSPDEDGGGLLPQP
ncbi:MAG: PDZ domain-containing protein [Thermoleophilaceae bacterium]|nr:PDZ domain-containing protein [Thermoleophilaceae bacterium]